MPSQILHTIFGEDVINGLRSRPETAGLKGIFTGCTSGAGETGCGAFSLGCQGPDIFYHSQRHKPVALEYGSLLHRRGCGTFSASLINMALQDKEDARETSLHYARETSLHYARETSLQNTGNLHYALGFMTHAFLDRHCHPYIIYHAGREYHSFFERIIDVLMLMELRRHDPVSWDKEKILADVCENPPAGLKELIISSLAETFPEKAGKDRSLAKRIDNTFVDCARFYNMTSPARIKEAFSGGERPAVSRRAINYMYPENLSSEIDCMRRVHTPPLWGETKGMNPETNTLPKQPYPVRSAAGLVDLVLKAPLPRDMAALINQMEKRSGSSFR
ncbi:MAG: zinc dependent phospholipase C family protein [Treponema sp.]|jgi:hypothetical protein|nr:zinc dependent phospholipase C family protein [Treponema sp.]